ncbi:PilZ domain-containing protein [Candidatus Poribacteria bacterium]|nr:PilZ domain-containing protein [Candidatus Poribacteria bacterium]
MGRKKEKLSYSDKRRFLRVFDNHLLFGRIKSNPHSDIKGFTKNISIDGLLFETEKNIPDNTELEVELYLSDVEYKTVIFHVACFANVIWSKEIEKRNFENGENRYRIGVEFLKIENEYRKRIKDYIDRYVQKSEIDHL